MGGGVNDAPPAEWMGLPNNGAAGLRRAAWDVVPPPLPAYCVNDASVLVAVRHGNNRVVILRARAPFNATPRCSSGNHACVHGILWRRGRGRGEALTLWPRRRHMSCFPHGDGGAAGQVGAVAVWRQGGGGRGPSGPWPGNDGKGKWTQK